ncbi:MAG TPA: 23S rRNA (uracil(1939)-C(5))-methyltransferase RlmD [Spirochaetota bacterium]|nr:23S rRNA (uracil(1939)-C(5))-methyltransferase RlmD [Spirochaetota bacterium]HPS85756.1 23S rRNA (uracil(1939)-C(5))-methyltransferase RlmD [Spirochaetota bacterium]
MKKKKKKMFAELIEKYKGEGCEPRCKYFGECGGCMFQNIPYENQLLLKKEYVNSIFEGIFSIESVAPSTPYGYRSRMDMVTAFGKKGLRRAGSFRHVVDIETCEIMQNRSNEMYGTVRSLVEKIEDYDYLRHEGYLRYIVLRQARFTGEVMVNFVVSKPENRFGFTLYDFMEEVDSSSLILSEGLGDLNYGDIFQTLKKGFITESFDGIDFMITPNSFFQSNSEMALQMYRKILSLTRGRTLDLYSGVGSISLFAASAAESVTGVEVIQEAVDVAERNRENNEIENVSFICADAGEYVRENSGKFETLILDPPRSGMNPKMLKHINGMAPERIVYMSCNPVTCRDDLKMLEGYNVDFLQAYDMFPQTPHVETLTFLTRK